MKNIAVLLGDPSINDRVKLGGVFQPEDIEVINILKRALDLLSGYRFEYFDNHSTILADIACFPGRFDYALNFCDEGFQNDPAKEAAIPEALERSGVLYTGAGEKCMQLCYNKGRSKRIAGEIGVPTSDSLIILGNEPILAPSFGFPAMVKPVYGDGSFGITEDSVVRDEKSYLGQVRWLRKKLESHGVSSSVLVEEFLPGKEFTVAMIGNPGSLEMRVIEEVFRKSNAGDNVISHKVKWDQNHFDDAYSIFAQLDSKTLAEVKEYSSAIFRRFELRDYGRVDFRMDKHGKPNLLEVNPNCGWVIDGHLAKAFMLGEENAGSTECYATNVLQRMLTAAEMRFKK